MFPVIGKLSDWTIIDNIDNNDGTKKLQRVYPNGCIITFNRAIIHEDLQMIEALPELKTTELMSYTIA